ncbi:MAG: hypothetical protein ABFS86_13165 [Planctomycetota bacterium]
MKPQTTVIIAIVTAFLGLAVGTMINRSGPETTAPGEADGERSEAEIEIEQLRERNRILQAENEAIARESDRVEKDIEEYRERIAELLERRAERAAAGESAPGTVPDASGRFFMDRYNGAMKKVDWKSVGSSMGEMSQLIAAIVPSLSRGEAPDMTKVGKIQKLNNNLIAAAALVQQDMPGAGINGAFSNPAFMVNAMSSTLTAVDKPLTDRQRKLIETIAADWIVADEKRRKAYDETTWTVRKLYEEAELKDGFFHDAFAVMTPEQVEALSPEPSRARVRLDLFSSSLIYVQRVRHVPFTETSEVIDFFVNQGLAGFRMNDEEKVRAKDMVTAWLDEVPTNLLFRETNALDLEGMVHSDRVTAWAKLEADMVKRLSETIEFDEKRTNLARMVGGVAVPLKKPDDGE